MNTTTIHVKIDTETRNEAKKVAGEFGFTLTALVNALLKQILHHHNAQGYNAQQLAYDLELKDISDLLAPYYK